MSKRYLALSILMILAALAATAVYYPDLPAAVPLHWDAEGHINRYGPRSMLLLSGPGAMGATLLLGLALPSLSPRRFAVSSFTPTYSYVIAVLVAMFGALYALLLMAALGRGVPLPRALPGGLFVLLILIGNPLGKVRRNFFIGVRTPWTLASDRVWYATHRLAAKLMVASGVAGLLAVAAGAPHWLLLALGIGWAVVPVLYSLMFYKRLQRTGQLG